MAYYSLEPFGYERTDLASAMVCDTFVKAMHGKKAKTNLLDFAPYIKQHQTKPKASDWLRASLGHMVRK